MGIGDLLALYGALLATALGIREWRASRISLTAKCEEPWLRDTPIETRAGWGHAFEFTVTNQGARPTAIREVGLLIRDSAQPNLVTAPLTRDRVTMAPGEWLQFVRRSSEVVELLQGVASYMGSTDTHVTGLYVELATGKQVNFKEVEDIGNYDVQGAVLASTISMLRPGSTEAAF
jgi:hypothetical protein